MFYSIANFYNTIPFLYAIIFSNTSRILDDKFQFFFSTSTNSNLFQSQTELLFKISNSFSRKNRPSSCRKKTKTSKNTTRKKRSSSFFFLARLCPQLLSLRFKFRLNYHEAERVCWRHDPGNKGWNESRNDRGGIE